MKVIHLDTKFVPNGTSTIDMRFKLRGIPRHLTYLVSTAEQAPLSVFEDMPISTLICSGTNYDHVSPIWDYVDKHTRKHKHQTLRVIDGAFDHSCIPGVPGGFKKAPEGMVARVVSDQYLGQGLGTKHSHPIYRLKTVVLTHNNNQE